MISPRLNTTNIGRRLRFSRLRIGGTHAGVDAVSKLLDAAEQLELPPDMKMRLRWSIGAEDGLVRELAEIEENLSTRGLEVSNEALAHLAAKYRQILHQGSRDEL